jgi:NAD(P)H-flavin reductase
LWRKILQLTNELFITIPTLAAKIGKFHCRIMITRAVHEVLTRAEPRADFLYRAVIERVLDFNDVRLLRLRAIRSDIIPPFQYEAGQWVDFIIPGVSIVGGYSFISSPFVHEGIRVDNAVPPCFDLAVKKSTHAPAAWVHSQQCSENTQVSIKVGGKYSLGILGNRHYVGSFADSDSGEHDEAVRADQVLFIAGGVGINPLYSMLLEMSIIHRISSPAQSESALPPTRYSALATPFSSPHVSCVLLWSVRSLADAAFLLPQLTQLAQVASDSNRLQVVITVTGDLDGGSEELSSLQQLLTSSNIEIRQGRMDTDMLCSVLDKWDTSGGMEVRRSAFVCGPPIMTSAVVDMLSSQHHVLNFNDENVHTEKWW